MKQPHISPTTAMLINTNIMLGTGIFINTVKLGDAVGILSPLIYVLVGIFLYPLIRIFMLLQETAPRGSLYEFGALAHPHLGFISVWGYYVSKLASAYLGIHVFTEICTRMIPQLPPLATELSIIGGFTWLYQQRVEVTSSMQHVFMACKLLPLVSIIIIGSWWLIGAPAIAVTLPETLLHIPAAIPFVLFAFGGFEASCALSQSLPNPKRDAPRVIITSYATAVLISTLYQASSWFLLGNELTADTSYIQAFAQTLKMTIPAIFVDWVYIIALTAIAISALSASYSIVFSNTWNLHKLARKQLTWFSRQLSQTNQYHMPMMCSLFTGALLIGYLVWSNGDATLLQQIGAAGATWAYTISVLAWWLYSGACRGMCLAAWGSCAMFLIATVQSAVTFGIHAYLVFLLLIAIGAIMYLTTETHQKSS